MVLKLDHASGPRVPVSVAGLTAVDVPDPTTRRTWEFGDGSHGWGYAPHDVRTERHEGKLVVTATAGDPYFSGPRLALPSDEIGKIVIRARVTQAGTFQVFFANDAGGYAPERSVTTSPIAADGAFHEAVAEVTGHPQWRGTLRRLRLDPPGGESVVTEIESIRLEP